MRASSVRATECVLVENTEEGASVNGAYVTGVRELSASPRTHRDHQKRLKPLAHPSNRLVAQLNASWRVVDDPLQWILQRKKGKPRSKNSGWMNRSYCTSREGLLRCVAGYCGQVDPATLETLTALPEHHPIQNLDVHGTVRAHVDGHSKAPDYENFESADQCSISEVLSRMTQMSFPTYGVNDANAVKHWSKLLSMSARDTTPIAPLLGEDNNSIVQVKTETSDKKGDTVHFSLLARLSGDGFTEGQVGTGNAEAMTLYQDSATINEIGHVCAPPSQYSIDHQRIQFNLSADAKNLARSWFGEHWATRLASLIM